MSFEKLDQLNRKLHAIGHAMAILGADEAIHMPPGGGKGRADSLSSLAAMQHEMASTPRIADWIEKAQGENLTADQKIGLEEFSRLFRQRTCLPPDLVRRKTATAMACEQLWRQARPEGDWKSLQPLLQDVIELAREEAGLRAAATGLAPYDALIDQYDPGSTMAEIDPVFSRLKSFLTSFLPRALEAQKKRHADQPLKPLKGPFPVEKQRALGLAAMEQLGFDFTHGRLDISHHPFCGGVPTDVRMTTRYDTDSFIQGLMGTLHETGHALYEQGLPRQQAHWPHNLARGMAMHESQSLFVEMQIVRSRPFWQWALPLLARQLGSSAFEGWSVEDMLAHVNVIERGYIRVDADEVTYPLHVILRYELEQDLIDARLDARDLPEAWNAKMEEYLGLNTLDKVADGPMQDVHWPAGLFGYFPSYTLGALMAAQQWHAMERKIPDATDRISRGDFATINDWRRENIWSRAS
ncbi:MAG TPA: carboxypeptidase M32, partial [Devosia sp.]|nr:carboxypeptidase M32 [Devosia sp.]